ncbi:MAG: cell division protein ZapA [Hyphomonadaceae bacterium]|nr:cell division protein ZapA [Hyphomonadaceae bacterium]
MFHVTVLGEDIALSCEQRDEQRIADLAAALERRISVYPGDAPKTQRLLLTALCLLDEVQAKSAALALARSEIERLTDLVVEAKLEAETQTVNEDRGRVASLRANA